MSSIYKLNKQKILKNLHKKKLKKCKQITMQLFVDQLKIDKNKMLDIRSMKTQFIVLLKTVLMDYINEER